MAAPRIDPDQWVRLAQMGRRCPDLWVEDVLDVTLTPDQRVYFQALAGHKWIHLRSGHSTGKTFALAATMLWFGATRERFKIITTAAVARQVRRQLWGEAPVLWAQARLPLPGKLLTQSWEVGNGSYAIGFSTDYADRFTGTHDGSTMFLLDEGQKVSEQILTGVRGSMQGEDSICVFSGNPVDRDCAFFAEYQKGTWHCVKFSMENHPNIIEGREVIPGGPTREWIEECREAWGEARAEYIGRVSGEFPEDGSQGLIQSAWLDAAVARYKAGVKRTGEALVMGVDVAGHGDDLSAWIIRDDASLLRIESQQTMDPVHCAKRTMTLAKDWGVPAENVHVDMTGEGHGTVARCHEDGFLAHGVHFGGGAWNSNIYANCRAEMYCQLRDALDPAKGGTLAMPEHKLMLQELRSMGYTYDKKERYLMWKKDVIKKLLGRSPDFADALALTYTTGARAWVA